MERKQREKPPRETKIVDVLAGICASHRDRSFAVINKPSATNRDFNPAQFARIFPDWFGGA